MRQALEIGKLSAFQREIMGAETITILISLAAVTVLAILLGRLVTTILQVAVVAAILYFVATRVDWKTTPLCQPTTGLPPAVTTFICK